MKICRILAVLLCFLCLWTVENGAFRGAKLTTLYLFDNIRDIQLHSPELDAAQRQFCTTEGVAIRTEQIIWALKAQLEKDGAS